MFIHPLIRNQAPDKNVVNPIIINMLSRIKSAWRWFQRKTGKFFSALFEIIKLLFIGSVIFIGIPQAYELTDVSGRLDANIYDFYGAVILVYLVYRVHVLEVLVRSLKKPERVYLSMEDDDRLDDDEWFQII